MPMLVTMIITIFLLTAYESIKPVEIQSHNFIPLPQTFPDLDKIQSSSCNTLTKCSEDGKCTSCGSVGSSVYQCTEIGDGEKVFFNGEKVPAGTWCLPAGKGNVACNPHTGRAIWSEDKGWECACLYPDLFGGKDCSTAIACQAPNAPGVDQSGNVLVHKDTGVKWDPAGINSPYDTDPAGNPLYVCKCDSTQTKKFVRLPGDPYRCHLDPCSDKHEIPFWDSKQNKCDCTAKGTVNNEYAYSNVSKKCIRTPQCAWDDKLQQCKCPEGQVSHTCNSNTMQRTSTNAKPCPNIPGGSYCSNPCEGYCLNGGIGTISGTSCICKCPDKPRMKFSGKRCDDVCMKDGVSDPIRRCCSDNKYRVIAGEGPLAIRYWKCGSATSSCFTETSSVLMGDDTLKCIKDVAPGDVVMSATGEKTKVLFVDKVTLDGRLLVGVNGQEPFVTEDHCFYGKEGERLAYNDTLAKTQKHWEQVGKYKEPVVVAGAPCCTPVIDVITEAHTLVVNGVKFYDDMPEVEKHPEVSVVCALLAKTIFSETGKEKIAKSDVDEIADELYQTKLARQIITYVKHNIPIISQLYKVNMEWFLEMAKTDQSCLHVCSSLWKHKFTDIKDELELR